MNISAVLLAGGESRRMGKDKATLLFRGRPLWQIQLELLRQLEPAEIFISARTDPTWRPADVEFVADDPPSRGPLSGLAASLAQMCTKHLLALAIDMPFMTQKYLKFLCGQIEPGRGVLPEIGNRAEPLVAIYPREVDIDFRSALSGADFSLQTLTSRLAEAGKLRTISVPDDVARICWRNDEIRMEPRTRKTPLCDSGFGTFVPAATAPFAVRTQIAGDALEPQSNYRRCFAATPAAEWFIWTDGGLSTCDPLFESNSSSVRVRSISCTSGWMRLPRKASTSAR